MDHPVAQAMSCSTSPPDFNNRTRAFLLPSATWTSSSKSRAFVHGRVARITQNDNGRLYSFFAPGLIELLDSALSRMLLGLRFMSFVSTAEQTNDLLVGAGNCHGPQRGTDSTHYRVLLKIVKLPNCLTGNLAFDPSLPH